MKQRNNTRRKHFCTYWLATVPTSAGTGACLQNDLVPDGGSPPAQWCSIPTPAGVSVVRPSTPTACAPGTSSIETSVSNDRIGHETLTPTNKDPKQHKKVPIINTTPTRSNPAFVYTGIEIPSSNANSTTIYRHARTCALRCVSRSRSIINTLPSNPPLSMCRCFFSSPNCCCSCLTCASNASFVPRCNNVAFSIRSTTICWHSTMFVSCSCRALSCFFVTLM